MDSTDSLLAIGNILKFVCFDCADIKTQYVQSERKLNGFKKLVMTTKDHCAKCGGSRCYIKDPYGRVIKWQK